MTIAAELRALVLTMDPWLATTFTDVVRELGIEPQRPEDRQGVPTEIGRSKYEAVLLDFDTMSQAQAIIASIRGNPSNQNALIFAVATGAGHKQQALNERVNFIFERPFAAKEMRRVLYANYELMARERRRYFRCAVEVPVQLKRNDGEIELTCKTINVSNNGMAINSSTSFHLAERLEIALMLQEVGATVVARGTVVWDDKHGKTGISFDCADPEIQGELDKWLDSRFLRVLQASRTKAAVNNLTTSLHNNG